MSYPKNYTVGINDKGLLPMTISIVNSSYGGTTTCTHSLSYNNNVITCTLTRYPSSTSSADYPNGCTSEISIWVWYGN